MNKHRPDLFINTLSTMDYGVTANELSDDLAELLRAVQDTGKQGTLTLKLTVKPESLATGQVGIIADTTLKAPQQPKDKAFMFMTPDGNLQREDPRQKRLQFEAHEGAAAAAPIAAEEAPAPRAVQQA
ncbi:hypothetical protein SAMN05444390_1011525 [Marinobacterium lutimaris]|uniref:Uncharacterized protein n=2 Tax=Marinobacterium lutimaris TaxID=568106 RepID=A0A1H5XWM6_9GAMM|nr:hypothetical protein SAMN05444390_1011525 [Marinobacterium lutimaris]